MLAVAGKKLNKAEKLKLSFLFLETFFFFVWHLVCLRHGHRKHTLREGCPRRTLVSVGTSGAPQSSYRHQSSEAEQEWGDTDTAVYHRLLTLLLHSSFHVSIFISLFFFSLNRYRNMGNLLKVLTCTDLEQEPNFFLDFESEFLF